MELSSIFRQTNNTYSSLGEEYLYYILRNPVDIDELNKREKIVNFYDSNEKVRLDTQYICHAIGKPFGYSSFEQVDYIKDVNISNLKWHYINFAIILLSLITTFVFAKVGILMLIASICSNIILQFTGKTNKNFLVEPIRHSTKIISSAKMISDITPENVYSFKEKEKLVRLNKKILRITKIIDTSFLSGTPIEIIIDYLFCVTHFDWILIDLVLRKIKKNYDQIFMWATEIGYLESMIAVASFRHGLQYYTTPEFCNDNSFEIEDIYIPLINEPVANSIKGEKNILLTGSNASGKSTFLKTIGINAILAETINTVMAKKYIMPFGKIMSSMNISDNLEKSESYYVSEIKSLKRIIDNTDEKVICFIDEVLRGTNTLERVALAAHILKYLSSDNVLCFAATHDIELTDMLKNYYDNYHFEEKVGHEGYEFDYKLKQGKSNTCNAITLLKYFGYPEEITNSATKSTIIFEKDNCWKLDEQ